MKAVTVSWCSFFPRGSNYNKQGIDCILLILLWLVVFHPPEPLCSPSPCVQRSSISRLSTPSLLHRNSSSIPVSHRNLLYLYPPKAPCPLPLSKDPSITGSLTCTLGLIEDGLVGLQLSRLWPALVCAKRKELLYLGDHQVGDPTLRKDSPLPPTATFSPQLVVRTTAGRRCFGLKAGWSFANSSTSQNASSCVHYAEPHNLWFKIHHCAACMARCDTVRGTYNTCGATVAFSFWATKM